MSANIYRIFDLRMNEKGRGLHQALESMIKSTYAKYRVDQDFWQSDLILQPMYDVIQSRYEMSDELDRRVSWALNSGRTKNEMHAIRKNLTTGPRRVLVTFHNKITKRDVDLENPKALAAFKAANEILNYFLELEHEYMKSYLEGIRTHARLRRARRRQQTSQPEQSKQACPQVVRIRR